MPKKETEIIYYSWSEFSQDIEVLAERIYRVMQEHDLRFDGVFGIPGGGVTPALCLRHAFNLPLLLAPTPRSLVVDDIADKGESLLHYRSIGCFIATLYYHPQSIVVPDLWLRQKPEGTEAKEVWIEFPWERKLLEKLENS